MRISICLVACCLISLFVPVVSAQTVEQDNVLVFYFDEDATVRSWYGTGEVTAYLIAGPMVHFDGTPYALMNSWGANGMKIEPFGNVASATLMARGTASPASYEFTSESMSIGFALLEPLPLNGRTVLAELTLMVTSNEPTGLTPCYDNGGSCDVDGVQRWFEILRDQSGTPVLATATINGEAPVATVGANWGKIKALFR